MKTLSIQQPYAGLITLGLKQYETRTWNAKHRGKLAIHSSAKMTREGKELLQWLTVELPDKFFPGSEAMNMCNQMGMVLGAVTLTDTYSTNSRNNVLAQTTSIERLLGDYEPNRYFWKCENPVVFPSPVPAVGKLGLWNWEPPEWI